MTGHRPPLTYSLTLKPSVISTVGSAAPTDLTDLARDWKRSIRLQGGFWTGTFSIPLNKRAFEAFDTWLGCHVEERSGGMVTWEGMVYEMELSTNGFVYRVSLDSMYNRVRANYDEAGGPGGGLRETYWATNDTAIARFGTRETQLEVKTTVGDVAERVRDSSISETGWPWPKAIGICPMNQQSLSVTVNGYAFMLNWKYNSGGACADYDWCDDPAVWAPGYTPVCNESTPACDFYGWWDSLADLTYNVPNSWFRDIDATALDNWTTRGFETDPALVVLTDPTTWAQYSIYWVTDLGTCYGYLGMGTDPGAVGYNNAIYTYQDPQLTTPGYNVLGTGFGVIDTYEVRGNTSIWIRDILATDWAGVIGAGSIQINTIPVGRRNGNRLDIGGERGWDAIMRAVALSDWDYNPWRAWVGPGRYLHYGPISTTPVAYVMDGQWRADPAGSTINPWQLRPGVGKILNYRWAPPRSGYWLEDPALFLIEELTVDSSGNIQPSMADISQTENLLTWLESIPAGKGGVSGGAAPLPPNWNVEANQMNPVGPGGDMHGYWTVDPESATGYTWIHDDSIDLTGYY